MCVLLPGMPLLSLQSISQFLLSELPSTLMGLSLFIFSER